VVVKTWGIEPLKLTAGICRKRKIAVKSRSKGMQVNLWARKKKKNGKRLLFAAETSWAGREKKSGHRKKIKVGKGRG